jgi:endoglucanase
MLLIRVLKSFSIITLAVIISFSFFACDDAGKSEEERINKDELLPLRDYVIAPGHQAPQTFSSTTAVDLVSKIKIGWNLGNTFDAHRGAENENTPVEVIETRWVPHRTTRENIDTISNSGFNAIRIPVTWYKVLDSDFIIREDWLARVTEVVNYAEANDMYIIINSHHDEGIFKFTNNSVNNSLIRFERVWAQIAFQFKNYNEKLLFEALNEPRTRGSEKEWQGGNSVEHSNLNKHYKIFVDTVRASGGNNDKRILMVNTYAASAEQTAMKGLIVPADTAPNKIIVSIHAYAPFNYAHEFPGDSSWISNSSQITGVMNRASNTFVSKGIPVILGEFGARVQKDGPTRNAWAEFYVKSARDKKIPCILWDDGGNFKLLERPANTFNSNSYLNALMRGAGVN